MLLSNCASVQGLSKQIAPLMTLSAYRNSSGDNHGLQHALPPAAVARSHLLQSKQHPAGRQRYDSWEWACRVRLQWSQADWPDIGAPDTAGGWLGAQVAVRLEPVTLLQVGEQLVPS